MKKNSSTLKHNNEIGSINPDKWSHPCSLYTPMMLYLPGALLRMSAEDLCFLSSSVSLNERRPQTVLKCRQGSLCVHDHLQNKNVLPSAAPEMIHHPCILKSKTPHTPQYEVCVCFGFFWQLSCQRYISHGSSFMVRVLWVNCVIGVYLHQRVQSLRHYKAALVTVYVLPSTRGCIINSNIFTIFAFSHEGSVYMLMPASANSTWISLS